MEAKFGTGLVVKNLIDAVKDLINDANWDYSPTGLSMQAMDSSHVSLVAANLKSEGFKKYECKTTGSLGINTASLVKILKCMKNDSSLVMSHEGGDTLGVSCKGRSFKMKLIDIDSEHLGIPDEEYKCVVKMPSKSFQKEMKNLKTLGDTAVIHVTKKRVTFKIAGDLAAGEIYKEVGVDPIRIQWKQDVELTFALRYLESFCKATVLNDDVVIKLAPERPVCVQYSLVGHDDTDFGSLRFFLAPKIEEDAPPPAQPIVSEEASSKRDLDHPKEPADTPSSLNESEAKSETSAAAAATVVSPTASKKRKRESEGDAEVSEVKVKREQPPLFTEYKIA